VKGRGGGGGVRWAGDILRVCFGRVGRRSICVCGCGCGCVCLSHGCCRICSLQTAFILPPLLVFRKQRETAESHFREPSNEIGQNPSLPGEGAAEARGWPELAVALVLHDAQPPCSARPVGMGRLADNASCHGMRVWVWVWVSGLGGRRADPAEKGPSGSWCSAGCRNPLGLARLSTAVLLTHTPGSEWESQAFSVGYDRVTLALEAVRQVERGMSFFVVIPPSGGRDKDVLRAGHEPCLSVFPMWWWLPAPGHVLDREPNRGI
jgi:hypothetical protein